MDQENAQLPYFEKVQHLPFMVISEVAKVYLGFSLVTLNSKGRTTKAELCLLKPSNETEMKSSATYWPQSWPFIF